MKPGELLLVAAVWGIPLVLVARAWWRYAAVSSAPPADLFRMRVALPVLSLSMLLWIFVLVLMSVGAQEQALGAGPL